MRTQLSSADAAWLHMDRPNNLMVINSVLLFDRPVDWEQVKRITAERLVAPYPRFRQKVVENRLPFIPPSWEDDPDFVLEHHMHHRALPAPGDEAALQALIADLMTMPLDRTKPLWHIYMIDGFGDGAAMLTRMHHCIADGIALARVMLSLTDEQPGAVNGHRRAAGTWSDPQSGPGLAWSSGLRGFMAAREAVRLITSPRHALRRASDVTGDASTALRLLLTPADRPSALKGEPGVSRQVAWSSPLPLPWIKELAHAEGVTVNDVLLAAISGALRHYLHEHHKPAPEMQVMVPFNLRPLSEPIPRDLGNRFGLVFLALPVGSKGERHRLHEVHKRMEEIKRSRDGAVSYELLSLSGFAPEAVAERIVDLFSGKATAVMTNVPGPREPVYLAGAPVRSVLVWAPTSGHIGMSVSIFSYRDEVTVGFMVDPALLPDPQEVADDVERELAKYEAVPAHP